LDNRRVDRRLAAILAADVAGYSRLMGADEVGTLTALKAHRRELIDPKIEEHRGRIVKTTGDGMLVEFASVVDAVRCAMEVNRDMVERNAEVPQEKRIEFRVGINVGDIIVDDADIFGDGVNIAARLESLAEPGGLCISRKVRDEVRDKLDLAFEDLGEQVVKNITRPVRVFRVAAPSIGQPAASTKPALALPDKPSIAVLPFQNMSGDPEQEYFADGIVEDMITALSRVKSFFVIARNSSFTYKGRAIDVKQVSRELGVRYVLEGSVRKAGDRIRITCQLIEGPTNHHVWADRFEGNLADVFDLQDRTTESVTAALEPNLQLAEINRIKRKPTMSLSAYDYYLRGLASMHRWSQESCMDALRQFGEATKLDPEFSIANATAARCQLWRWANDWMANRDQETAEALLLARRGVEFGKDDPAVLSASGFVIAILDRDL
jgi:TolB-like protein/class 3 adenylate cyclase